MALTASRSKVELTSKSDMAGDGEGNRNCDLEEIQREMYFPLSSKLLEYASHEYLALYKVLRHEPSVSPQSFLRLNQDYPIIDKVYAVIARSFAGRTLEENVNGMQQQPRAHAELLRRAWQNYFLLEARRLAMIPSFADRLLHAVVETNPELSTELEGEILRFLEQEYPAKE